MNKKPSNDGGVHKIRTGAVEHKGESALGNYGARKPSILKH